MTAADILLLGKPVVFDKNTDISTIVNYDYDLAFSRQWNSEINITCTD